MIKRLPLVLLLCVFTAGTVALAQDKVAEIPKSPAPAGKEKIMIFQGEQFKVQMYGYIQFDNVYNTTSVTNDDGPFWVDNMKAAGVTRDQKEGSFLQSVRNTRLGLKMTGIKTLGADTTILIEGDFWGYMPASGTASRQPSFRLRQAFVKLDWPTKTYLQAGQSWCLLFPTKVVPDGVTLYPFVSSGLVLERVQLVHIGQSFGSRVFMTTIEAGINRSMGGDPGSGIYPGAKNTYIDDRGPGEASGMPAYKGRLTFEISPIAGLAVIIGGAYHYSKENREIGTTKIAEEADSACYLGFAKISYSLFSIAGHYYQAKNIDQYNGGIIQGTVEVGGHIKEVGSDGGWIQGKLDLNKIHLPLSFAFGYGYESITENRAYVTRKKNSTMMGTAWITLSQYYQLGLEVAKMETRYAEGTTDDMRYHAALKFIF